MRGGDHDRLAVADVIGHVLRGEVLQRTDDGEADEVGEGDLSTAGPLEMGVDDDAVVDEGLRRQCSHGRGRGNLDRIVHVLGDQLRRTAQRSDGLFGSRLGLGILHDDLRHGLRLCLQGLGLSRGRGDSAGTVIWHGVCLRIGRLVCGFRGGLGRCFGV